MGKGLGGPQGPEGWDLATEAGPGPWAAPTCAGRPQAEVAEVAQAAGLRLRGGFSITTSPAQERAGRGAAPGAAGARAHARGGAPSWAGRASASPRGGSGPASGAPHPAPPSGLGEPTALRPRRPLSLRPVPESQSAASAPADPCPAPRRPPL